MPVSGPTLRFLVAEDDDAVREGIVRMVTRQGHHAEHARDGVEAVRALMAARYDVMLLDLEMPRMPGEDVMRWLKGHPRWAEGLRVVVVTALVGDQQRRLEALGVCAIVVKPLRAKDVRLVAAACASDARRLGELA